MSETKPTRDLLDVIRDSNPQKTAAVFATETLSYGALAARASAVASQLQDGPVLLLARNPLNALVGWVGCYHRGVTCAIIDPVVFARFRAEIDSRFKYSQVILDSDLDLVPGTPAIDMRSLPDTAWVDAGRRARQGDLVLATSRTTGALKLVRHSHTDLAKHHCSWSNVAALQERDFVACQSHLSNAYVFNIAVIWTLWSGRTVCFVPVGGKPHSKTTVSCLPMSHLQRCPVLAGLRLAVSAGQMIHMAEWEWFARTYSSARLLNKVGATETLTCFLISEDPVIFRPLAPYVTRVVDEAGHVVVGAPGRFEFKSFFVPSYVGRDDVEAAITSCGWTRLGDFAVDNGDGTYRFLGRNTVSFDLENALRLVDGVRDCHYCEHEGMPALLVESSSMTVGEVQEQARRFGADLPETRIAVLERLSREPSGKVLAATVGEAFKRPTLPDQTALDNLPDIALAAVKNMWVRQMYFPKAGVMEQGHSHPIDHMTLLARGGLRVIVNGFATEFYAHDGGKIIYIRKDVEHTLVALEDQTLAFCVHALREDNVTEDIIDPESIPAGVDALSAGLAAPLVCGETVRGRSGRLPLDVAYR